MHKIPNFIFVNLFPEEKCWLELNSLCELPQPGMWIWLEEQRGGQRKCWSSSTPSSAPLHSSSSWCSCTSSSWWCCGSSGSRGVLRWGRYSLQFYAIIPVFQNHARWGSQVVDDASSPMPIVFLLFIFPRLRAQLLALHLRGGVPRGAFFDGLAVCAEEVPLGRLDSANQLGHLQRGHRQHSAAHHGWGGAGHGGEEWRVQSPDNDTQFSLGDPPGPSFLHFCSYPKIWWWVCITLESCQENGLWMSYF